MSPRYTTAYKLLFILKLCFGHCFTSVFMHLSGSFYPRWVSGSGTSPYGLQKVRQIQEGDRSPSQKHNGQGPDAQIGLYSAAHCFCQPWTPVSLSSVLLWSDEPYVESMGGSSYVSCKKENQGASMLLELNIPPHWRILQSFQRLVELFPSFWAATKYVKLYHVTKNTD